MEMVRMTHSSPSCSQDNEHGINDGLNSTKFNDGNYTTFYDCIEIGENILDRGCALYRGRWVIENDDEDKSQVIEEEQGIARDKSKERMFDPHDAGDVGETDVAEIRDVESAMLYEMFESIFNTCLDKLGLIRNLLQHANNFSIKDKTLAAVAGVLWNEYPNPLEDVHEIDEDGKSHSAENPMEFHKNDEDVISDDSNINDTVGAVSEGGQIKIENGVECSKKNIQDEEKIMYSDQVFFDPLISQQSPNETDWDYDHGPSLNSIDQINDTSPPGFSGRNIECDNSRCQGWERMDGDRQCVMVSRPVSQGTQFSAKDRWKDECNASMNHTVPVGHGEELPSDSGGYIDLNNNREGMTAAEEEEVLKPMFVNRRLLERIEILRNIRRNINMKANLLLTWNLIQLLFLVFTFIYASSCVCSFKKSFTCSTQCESKGKKPKTCAKPKLW